MGWLEGTAILTAVLVVVLVGSINDYQALFFYFCESSFYFMKHFIL